MSDIETKFMKGVTSTRMARVNPYGKALDRRIVLAMMLVEEGTRRQFFIGDIARAVNLSTGRLAHLFKSEVGVSPQRYLMNIRLEKATELLEIGGLSVKEIAAEIGIASVSRFCRSFKSRYGVTPNEYRKTHLRLDLRTAGALVRARER
jgi:AraC family transcriptional regulator of arabinose operon